MRISRDPVRSRDYVQVKGRLSNLARQGRKDHRDGISQRVDSLLDAQAVESGIKIYRSDTSESHSPCDDGRNVEHEWIPPWKICQSLRSDPPVACTLRLTSSHICCGNLSRAGFVNETRALRFTVLPNNTSPV